MTRIIYQMGLIFFLIGLNGFFAMSEIALITISPARLKILVKNGNKSAKRTLFLIENSNRFLSTIQIGITFAGFLASASTAVILAEPLAQFIGILNIPIIVANRYSIAIFLATVFVAYLSLVFGELVPKQLALKSTVKIALLVSYPIQLLSFIAYPLVKALSWSTRLILKLIPYIDVNKSQQVTEEEIRQIVKENQQVAEEEKEMIEGVFEFGDTRVEQIMTPRTDIVSVPIDASIEDTFRIIFRTGFSRLPVLGKSLDDIKGIIHVRDLSAYFNKVNIKLKDIIKPVYYIPESKGALALLEEIRNKGGHMAIVIDEYGGTSGLITLEDLLEKIVGEIEDIHNLEEEEILRLNNSEILVDGNIEIDKLNREIPVVIPVSDKYSTLAGYILDVLHHVPVKGEQININNWIIEIRKVVKNRIVQVKLNKKDDIF